MPEPRRRQERGSPTVHGEQLGKIDIDEQSEHANDNTYRGDKV